MADMTNDEQLEAIKNLLTKHEENLRWSYGTPNLATRTAYLLAQYQRKATDSLAASKNFRDEILVNFRALAMVADMVTNAGTHREKDARLRGLVELLESSVKKLRDFEFKFSDHYWQYEDVFRSDYPTREYVRRIHELEDENKRLRKEAGEAVPDESNPNEPMF